MKQYNDNFLELFSSINTNETASKEEIDATANRVFPRLCIKPEKKHHRYKWIAVAAAVCAMLAIFVFSMLSSTQQSAPPKQNDVTAAAVPSVTSDHAIMLVENDEDFHEEACMSSAVSEMAADGQYMYYVDEAENQLRRLDIATKEVAVLQNGWGRLFQTEDGIFFVVSFEKTADVYRIEAGKPVFLLTLEYTTVAANIFGTVAPIGIIDNQLLWIEVTAVSQVTHIFETDIDTNETHEKCELSGFYPTGSLAQEHIVLYGDSLAIVDAESGDERYALQMDMCRSAHLAGNKLAFSGCFDMMSVDGDCGMWVVDLSTGSKIEISKRDESNDAIIGYRGVLYYTSEMDGVQSVCTYDIKSGAQSVLFDSGIIRIYQLLPTDDGIICFVPGGKDHRGYYYYDFDNGVLSLLIRIGFSGGNNKG